MNYYNADELQHLQEMRIILLGRTGRGKSAVGNSICGSQERNSPFETGVSSSSITQKPEIAYREYGDRILCVIDTPGLFDTNRSIDETIENLTNAFYLAAPGPHAFLIVLCGRCTNEDQLVIDLLNRKFGQYLTDYCIIVVSREDDLRENDKQSSDNEVIGKYFENAPQTLKNLLRKCENRCILIDNRAAMVEREQKIAMLIDMIKKNEVEHGNSYYNQEMFDQAKQYYQEGNDEEFDRQQQECEINLEKMRERIASADCIQKEALKLKKEINEIRHQKIDRYSTEEYNLRVAWTQELPVAMTATILNKILDNSSIFPNEK